MATNPTFSYGLIAGGMNDGYVHIWDPAKLAIGETEPLIASVEQHQGKLNKIGSVVTCFIHDHISSWATRIVSWNCKVYECS
jgi:hypothetical protein